MMTLQDVNLMRTNSGKLDRLLAASLAQKADWDQQISEMMEKGKLCIS